MGLTSSAAARIMAQVVVSKRLDECGHWVLPWELSELKSILLKTEMEFSLLRKSIEDVGKYVKKTLGVRRIFA